MDNFEKVEKLRQRANVSYEEAREALDAANGDLLDAMIYLEKKGKVAGNDNVEKFTGEVVDYPAVNSKKDNSDKKEKKNANGKSAGEKFSDFCKKAWQKGNDNEFVVRHKDEVIIRIPVWVMIVILVFTFHITLPVMLISLFFSCKYGFEGKDDLSKVNRAMDKASDIADNIKDEFNK